MDIQDFTKELQENAKDFKTFAYEYKKERANHADAMNKLINLIYKAGLHDDKAAFENKLIKLLATSYAQEAKPLIEQFNLSHANYKGWEMVLESYKAHISSIQSVIKYNLTGELNQNVADKAEVARYY